MSAVIEREYMRERWFAVLTEAVANDPRGRQGVAERLGRGAGRSALSLILSGAYPARPGKVARRVLEVYDCHRCPYLGIDVKTDFCVANNAAQVPTWDPAALDLRRHCQTCEHCPATPATPAETVKEFLTVAVTPAKEKTK